MAPYTTRVTATCTAYYEAKAAALDAAAAAAALDGAAHAAAAAVEAARAERNDVKRDDASDLNQPLCRDRIASPLRHTVRNRAPPPPNGMQAATHLATATNALRAQLAAREATRETLLAHCARGACAALARVAAGLAEVSDDRKMAMCHVRVRPLPGLFTTKSHGHGLPAR